MFWSIFILALAFDQLTKLFASLYLRVELNQGVSFGWLAQLSDSTLTIFLFFLVIGLAYGLRKEWSRHQVVAGLFWAGAISNLLDRAFLGGVVDWVPLPLIEVRNNLADFYLSISLLYLFIKELKVHSEN